MRAVAFDGCAAGPNPLAQTKGDALNAQLRGGFIEGVENALKITAAI